MGSALMTRSQPHADGTSATGGADGVVERDATNEARKTALSLPRFRIACINWSHITAPKAVVYLASETHFYDRYFSTWAEALEWANEKSRERR